MRILRTEDVPTFVRGELLDPERLRPVVALSTMPHSQKTWLDPRALEESLGEKADVVLLETGDPTWELARHLPPRLDVYGGAIRIWWPGLRLDSDPHEHELLFVRSEPQAQAVHQRILRRIRSVTAPAAAEDAWERVLREWKPGDVVEGRVQNVKDFGCFVDLLPGVRGLVHKSEIDWTFVEDPNQFVRRGAAVKVKILEIDAEKRRITLSVKRALTEAPRAPLAVVPEGPPLAWTPAPAPTDRNGAPSELEERLERVSAEAEASAAERADMAQEIRALRQQLTEARRALRSEKDRHAALERRVAGELDPLSSERAFLLAVRLCHARMFDEDDRAEHPLRRMRAGRRFLESARALEGLDVAKLIEVCAQVACNFAQAVPARELHQLRAGERGSASRQRASDGALAWRCSLQDNTPSARRLHYWNVPGADGGTVEFALACVHDVVEIPE